MLADSHDSKQASRDLYFIRESWDIAYLAEVWGTKVDPGPNICICLQVCFRLFSKYWLMRHIYRFSITILSHWHLLECTTTHIPMVIWSGSCRCLVFLLLTRCSVYRYDGPTCSCDFYASIPWKVERGEWCNLESNTSYFVDIRFSPRQFCGKREWIVGIQHFWLKISLTKLFPKMNACSSISAELEALRCKL